MRIFLLMLIAAVIISGCTSNTTPDGPIDNTSVPAEPTTPEPPAPDPPSNPATVKEFNVVAKRYEFVPNEIEVNLGDTVKLNLMSTDVDHGFSIATFDVIEYLPVGLRQ
jgi:heme/copper-type cytochrome/quinol oxidase subunit 2